MTVRLFAAAELGVDWAIEVLTILEITTKGDFKADDTGLDAGLTTCAEKTGM